MYRHFTKLSLAGLIAVALLTNIGQAQPVEFEPLGYLPGSFYSNTTDVSGDGSVVVGYGITASGLEAFRWTSGGGIVELGYLPGDSSSVASGLSADGSVVVGRSDASGGSEAFRWTSGGGMVELGDLGSFYSSANGVSADGSVVVGLTLSTSGHEAFRWTDADGMVELGNLPGGIFYGWANGVSADGSTVVGFSSSASSGYNGEAFRWTEVGGMVGLGDLPGGSFSSQAIGVSADGSVVVGGAYGTSGSEAFRWTSGGGMVGLGYLPGGGGFSQANDVSADGSVVVGQSDDASGGSEAFRWTDADGMVSIKQLLTDGGIDLTGWSLLGPSGVSDDGTVIVGVGTNPDGNIEGWIARLGPGLITVAIDIKPGSDPNSINLCSKGAVPLAVLGSDTLDVSDVDTNTLRFADATVKMVGKKDPRSLCSTEDVNLDGFFDLVCHFVTTDIAALDGETTSATVNGELFDGTPIEGSDSVNIVKDTCY